MSYLARLLLGLLAYLPLKVSQFLGALVGRISYRLQNRAARVTRTNLELCIPELHGEALDQMVRASLVETGKTFFETPAVWLGNLERVDRWIVNVHNEGLLQEKINDRNGLLILLPHLGNWELFNVFYRRFGELTALYHPPRQPYLKDIMQHVRSLHGNHLVPTDRSGLMALFRALNHGKTVVVLPDQVPAQGRFIKFLGEAALTDTLSSRLIQKTGASVLGIGMIRQTDGLFDVHVESPSADIYSEDADTSSRAVNQLVETLLLRAPEQYQWEYKRFKVRPVGTARLYRYKKEPAVH
jgi:KDO2-lipid IV(A) lauroyltransferase